MAPIPKGSQRSLFLPTLVHAANQLVSPETSVNREPFSKNSQKYP